MAGVGKGSGSSSGSNDGGIKEVDDSQLTGVPVGRLEGIPDGPLTLPSPASSSTTWAVCDDINYNPDMPTQVAQQGVQTYVLAGVSNLGQQLPDPDTAYVAGPDGKDYLIYSQQHNVNNENDSDVRAAVDTGNSAVMTALGLTSAHPRQISAALLNAIPYVGQITNPIASYVDHPETTPGLPVAPGLPFMVQRSSTEYDYYIALPTGVEQVSEAVAEIARFANPSSAQNIQVAVPGQVDNLPQLQNDPLGVKYYPGNITTNGQIEAGTDQTMCLGWTADYGNPNQPIAHTSIFLNHGISQVLPADKDNQTGKMAPVQIGTPAPNGIKIDYFLMNSPAVGDGITVHAATNAGEFVNGPIYIVSARGTKYSVPDMKTAQALGVSSSSPPQYGIWPAPQSILGLLPTAQQDLSVQSVQRSYDTLSVPANAGQYAPPPTSTQGGS
jgi:hypothetical protein